MSIAPIESGFAFTKDWRNENDFPTYEGDEQTVRADMQLLHEEMKTYVNSTLIEIINEIISDVNQFETGSVTDDSVYTAAIQDLAVTTAKLADLVVTAAKLANKAVTTAKIDDEAVTNTQVSASANIDYEKCRIHAVTELPTSASPEGIYLYYSTT